MNHLNFLWIPFLQYNPIGFLTRGETSWKNSYVSTTTMHVLNSTQIFCVFPAVHQTSPTTDSFVFGSFRIRSIMISYSYNIPIPMFFKSCESKRHVYSHAHNQINPHRNHYKTKKTIHTKSYMTQRY